MLCQRPGVLHPFRLLSAALTSEKILSLPPATQPPTPPPFLSPFPPTIATTTTTTTTPQSHGILANTAIAWTFLLSSSLRLDNFTSTKALFVLITFLGVACDTFARNMSAAPESEADRWWGGFLAIGSALFYAIYTCLLKSLLPNDEKVDMVRTLLCGQHRRLNSPQIPRSVPAECLLSDSCVSASRCVYSPPKQRAVM